MVKKNERTTIGTNVMKQLKQLESIQEQLLLKKIKITNELLLKKKTKKSGQAVASDSLITKKRKYDSLLPEEKTNSSKIFGEPALKKLKLS